MTPEHIIIEDPESGLRVSYGGGRLADILDSEGSAVECCQVRDYDFATGTFGPSPSPFDILERVKAFIAEAWGEEA